jgi:hypothetical protein
VNKACSTAHCAVGDRTWLAAAYDGSPASRITLG